MKKKLLPLIFLLGHSLLFAQFSLPPASDEIYTSSEVSRIDITIDQAYLDLILAPGNESSDEEYPADFTFTTDAFTADEHNIGFRLRGNTSRNSAKKSFKVSFNTFEKGRDLLGYEKLNLNGEHNDPSIIRSKICWDLMQRVGVVASRAAHTTLYINGEYKGLYINVEHIDEEFVDERFGNKDGNLYKCLYPADLNYLGSDPELYKKESGSRRMYELKTNEEADDYSGLAHFIKILNQTSAAQFEEKIEEVFDVDSYLKILVVEMLTGHWDNYGLNKNNFYLYHNPTDNKFYYIPYDMDNTLGVDFIGGDWAERDVYEWYDESSNRPLTRRIMTSATYRDRFGTYVYQILEEHYNPEVLFPEIDRIKAMITPYAEADTYKALDYGFSNADFHNSYEQELPYGFIREGLKPFIQKRYGTAQDQVVLGTDNAVSFNLYPNPFSSEISLSVSEGAYEITVLDINGRVIHSDFSQLPLYKWTGTDITGTPVPSGIYLLQINTNFGSSLRKKIILQR